VHAKLGVNETMWGEKNIKKQNQRGTVPKKRRPTKWFIGAYKLRGGGVVSPAQFGKESVSGLESQIPHSWKKPVRNGRRESKPGGCSGFENTLWQETTKHVRCHREETPFLKNCTRGPGTESKHVGERRIKEGIFQQKPHESPGKKDKKIPFLSKTTEGPFPKLKLRKP